MTYETPSSSTGVRCDDDAHSPRREEARRLAADPAVADQPQRPSREVGPDRPEAPVGPVALVQRLVALAQAVGEREDERHRGRRHRVCHPSGVIVTATPRSVHASTSTKSRPTPCRARIASRSTPEAARIHGGGEVVEAVEPGEERRAERPGILGEELPLDPVHLEGAAEVAGREDERAVGAARRGSRRCETGPCGL